MPYSSTAWQGYSALTEHDTESLVVVSALVEELLIHGSMLPPELKAKLDTYHADLANAIETKGGSGEAESAAPESRADSGALEEGGSDGRF